MQVVINAGSVSVDVKMKTSFSKAELDLLARLVHSEAKGESYKGQVAVAATVLNRLGHPEYPNTLSGIINHVVVANGRRYYQYEPVLNGSITQPAGELAVLAVQDALAGWDPSLGATGFFAPAKVGSGSWVRTRPVTVNIGTIGFSSKDSSEQNLTVVWHPATGDSRCERRGRPPRADAILLQSNIVLALAEAGLSPVAWKLPQEILLACSPCRWDG